MYRDVSVNSKNVQNQRLCHKNPKYRNRANFRMWPVLQLTIHIDILAYNNLLGRRLIIENIKFPVLKYTNERYKISIKLNQMRIE